MSDETSRDVRHEGLRWIVRKSAKQDWMLNLVARNPRVSGPVRQLLGQELTPTGTRGVYSTRPCFTRAGCRIAPEDCPPIVGTSDRSNDAGATSILGGEGIHTDGLPLDRIGAVVRRASAFSLSRSFPHSKLRSPGGAGLHARQPGRCWGFHTMAWLSSVVVRADRPQSAAGGRRLQSSRQDWRGRARAGPTSAPVTSPREAYYSEQS